MIPLRPTVADTTAGPVVEGKATLNSSGDSSALVRDARGAHVAKLRKR